MKGVHNQSVGPSSQTPQLGEVVRQHTLGHEVVGSGGEEKCDPFKLQITF